MLDWFPRRQQTKILWSTSGMNFLSLLYCFSSVVSPRRMYGNISRYWCMYFSISSLVWGIRFYCAGYVGGYGFFWIEESCVIDSMYDVSVGFLSWYISVSFGRLMESGDMDLGLGWFYPLDIPVWYTHVLTCDQVVHPFINGEKKGG